MDAEISKFLESVNSFLKPGEHLPWCNRDIIHLPSPTSHKREKLYLLAVGWYRSGEYSRSRQLVEQCLEIKPDWRQALSLKKTVKQQIKKDGVIGIGITTTTVGLIAGGIVAALDRKN